MFSIRNHSENVYLAMGSTNVSVQWGYSEAIVTCTSSTWDRFRPLFLYRANTTFESFIIKPQLFDLTQMFGAGNEPTTVAQFSAMFPADYYPYNAGETLHGDVTSIVTKRWGGRSIVWNQMIPIPGTNISKTENGVTFVDNRDGSYTVSTTASGASAATSLTLPGTYNLGNPNLGMVIVRGCPPNGSADTFGIETVYMKSRFSDYGSGSISENVSQYIAGEVIIAVQQGTIITTPITFKPQWFYITQMFGAGNEPTTVAQFRAIFPSDYYAYNAGEVLSPVIATHSVPAAVRALTGYGWGAGSAVNTVEYDATAKKWYYHQRVNRVRLADLTCVVWGTTGHAFRLYNNTLLSDLRRGASYGSVANIFSDTYQPNTHSNVYAGVQGMDAAICSLYDSTSIGIYDSHYSTAEQFAASLGEKVCYYEKDNETVTDITNLMTGFGNYLNEVELGGAITFENSRGADYEIPVSSQIDHYRNLSEVTP